MSYGPSYVERFGRAADYAGKILRGAKPGNLAVDQPTKYELVFNLGDRKGPRRGAYYQTTDDTLFVGRASPLETGSGTAA